MEQIKQIAFETKSIYDIGGIRFIVTAHFDETQESLPEKLARLLKKEVCTLDRP